MERREKKKGNGNIRIPWSEAGNDDMRTVNHNKKKRVYTRYREGKRKKNVD